MRCIDCNKDFEEKKEKRRLRVELSNPGVVLFEGQAIECPHCSGKYTSEEDIEELLKDFESNHKKKNECFAKA